MAQPVPEGEQRMSDVEIVAAVLKAKDCPSSTFLQNVGLKPSSSTSKGSTSAVVAAHVRDLKDKLERSQVEMAAMRPECTGPNVLVAVFMYNWAAMRLWPKEIVDIFLKSEIHFIKI